MAIMRKQINMLSSADKVKGQGVGSAYIEQVSLVREGLKDEFEVMVNQFKLTDIIHYHTIDLKYYLSIPFARMKGVTIGYVHFLPETIEGSIKLPGILKTIFYKYIVNFYKQMDYLVTVNPYFIDKLVDLGINKEQIYYIPNFVSKKQFYPFNQKIISESRTHWNLPQDKFIVLGVGQVQTRKGVLDFLEIAKQMPDLHFIWAGGFSFGQITDGYNQLKEAMENSPANVEFLGIVDRDKMNEIYNIADVLFMPSYNELFPMAILEAMNCQKPILLRDISIYEEILKDYYLKGSNNQEFQTVLRKLSADSGYYNHAQESANRGSEFYSKENVLHLWKEFYTKVSEKDAV